MKRNGHGEIASERIRQRAKAWCDLRGHGGQREMLRRMLDWCGERRSDQWLSDILNKRAKLVTDDIDLFAIAMEIPPGELVRWATSHYIEVSRNEQTLVRWFRALSSDARRFVLGFIAETFKEIDDLEKMTVAKADSTSAQWAGPDSLPVGGSTSHVGSSDPRRQGVDIPRAQAVSAALRAKVEQLRVDAEAVSRLFESETSPAAVPPTRETSKSAPRGGAYRRTPHGGPPHVGKKGA